MFCFQCGQAVPDEAVFCQFCGASLQMKPASEVNAANEGVASANVEIQEIGATTPVNAPVNANMEAPIEAPDVVIPAEVCADAVAPIEATVPVEAPVEAPAYQEVPQNIAPAAPVYQEVPQAAPAAPVYQEAPQVAPAAPIYQETPQVAPAAPAQVAQTGKKAFKMPTRLSAGSHIGSVFMCIFIMIVSSIGITSYAASKLSAEDTIESLLGSIDVASMEVGEILGGDDENTLADYIYDEVFDQSTIDKYDIPKEGIEELLDNKKLDKFISEEVSDYVNYLLTGKGDTLSADDIMKFVEDNLDEIEEQTNFRPNQDDLNDMEEWLEDALEEDGELAFLNAENIKSNIPSEFTILIDGLAVFSSNGFRIGVAIIGVIFLGLMILIDKRRPYVAGIYNGVTCLLMAVGCLGIYLACGVAAAAIADEVGFAQDTIKQILQSVLSGYSFAALVLGGIGVVSIAIYIIVNTILRNKAKQAKAA